MASPVVTIDQAAIDARKPRAGPLVDPAEAIAIALSVARWAPGGLQDPNGTVVQLVLKSVHDAGWKIEPR
ncbi:hypothetical protein JQ574_22890 [Bradyrhizobium sp. AUGA SZCCT0158]|uniref:hypothetical protein n=1 Tax=Bradyrhizobium sp. AUGA SZCCT0158 TaxID=2807661 RepID=UPI001BA62791|nr:hypothetical protein [Bradyrhizobium sp. AUGA SZCCT0158]MBR1198848.1 hypothetical protein [Bradyrhizobium sp. AUGA SZCCT0158]